MSQGAFSQLEIDAEPGVLYDVAADVASYPEWASGVKEVEVLTKDSDGRVASARFVVEAFVKEIECILHYTHDRPNTLGWSAEESDDLRMLEGAYHFSAQDGATEVVYSLTVDPKFKVPGFVRRQAEKQIVTTALRGLRERVSDRG